MCSAKVYGFSAPLVVVVNAKNLYNALSIHRNSLDSAICADVNILKYEFKSGIINTLAWIPGQTNLSDPNTKPHSPLINTLNLTLLDGQLVMDFATVETTVHGLLLGQFTNNIRRDHKSNWQSRYTVKSSLYCATAFFCFQSCSNHLCVTFWQDWIRKNIWNKLWANHHI